MGQQEDIWYAVNITKIIHPPQVALETFGATKIRYHFLSELMDHVDAVRLREGSVYSERPQIITPSHFSSKILDGFGEQAQEYADWLLEHGDIVRILKYGLHFRKEKISEKIISGNVDEIAEQMKNKVTTEDDHFSAVVIGADELWEVSLLKFVVDYIQQSIPINLQALAKRAKLIKACSNSQAISEEIEAEFTAAEKDRSQLESLGNILQQYNLFEEYEDRFYTLVQKV